MVWACAVQTKRFAYCAELNVRFLRPVSPGVEVTAVAELAANRRDRIFEAKAELRDPSGTVLASATGKYLPIKQMDAAEMETDFVDDPRWVFAPPGAA
jgi:acyl-coenzyme A thioesterase PaaI-like protein